MTNPLYFDPDSIKVMAVFTFIAILPTLIYVSFKKLSDNGSGGGLVGYYLTKLLRRLR